MVQGTRCRELESLFSALGPLEAFLDTHSQRKLKTADFVSGGVDIALYLVLERLRNTLLQRPLMEARDFLVDSRYRMRSE